MDVLELVALALVGAGVPGAVETLLRISAARVRLNGLAKPLDPRDEVRPKQRMDLSQFSDEALEIFEE